MYLIYGGNMPVILYANTVLDSQSESVNPEDNFLICKKINRKWHIIESHPTAKHAHKAMQIMADHALIKECISDPSYYMVCRNGVFETKLNM